MIGPLRFLRPPVGLVFSVFLGVGFNLGK